MASIPVDEKGRRRIQFTAPDKVRRSIRLGRVSKKVAEQVRFHIEEIIAAKTTSVPLNASTAHWLNTLSNIMRNKLVAVGLIEGEERVKLSEFMDGYINSRPSLKPNTVRNLRNSSSLLTKFYGNERQLHTISESDADAFREFLVSKGYAPATIGRVVKRARQFFTAAIRKDLIDSNPFAEVNAPQQVNDTRRQYIPEGVIYKAIEMAPNAEWRLIIALSRFGGLRIPSELLPLKWEDIDWGNGKIRVHQPKLEHLPGGSFRIMPLFPRLRPYLEEQFELAEPGSEYVISNNRVDNVNLRTQFLRILKRAMIQPWPRLFHNLRASFQTDVCEQFPAHVAAEWCGNSLEVAEKHYLSTTEDHFRRALESDRNTCQKVVQKAAHTTTAGGRQEATNLEFQESSEIASPLLSEPCGSILDSADLMHYPLVPRAGIEPTTYGLEEELELHVTLWCEKNCENADSEWHQIDKAFLIAEPMIKASWTKRLRRGRGGVFGWGLRGVAVEGGWGD